MATMQSACGRLIIESIFRIAFEIANSARFFERGCSCERGYFLNADVLMKAEILMNARLLMKARGPHLFVALL